MKIERKIGIFCFNALNQLSSFDIFGQLISLSLGYPSNPRHPQNLTFRNTLQATNDPCTFIHGKRLHFFQYIINYNHLDGVLIWHWNSRSPFVRNTNNFVLTPFVLFLFPAVIYFECMPGHISKQSKGLAPATKPKQCPQNMQAQCILIQNRCYDLIQRILDYLDYFWKFN